MPLWNVPSHEDRNIARIQYGQHCQLHKISPRPATENVSALCTKQRSAVGEYYSLKSLCPSRAAFEVQIES